MKKIKIDSMKKTNLLSVFNDPSKFIDSNTAIKMKEGA